MTADGPSFGVVIPARFASTRLPGKPLIDLGGKSMVVRVMELAARSGASFSIVATDDERIAAAVTDAGGEAIITSNEHETGTDRLAEVARRLHLEPDLILVNLQGDEPLLEPELIQRVAQTLAAEPEASLATVATPIRDSAALHDPNVVKVVLDQGGRALYFSRAPIPWLRGQLEVASGGHASAPDDLFLRHVGLYAYRVSTLLTLSQVRRTALEEAESLEQLRALWLGMKIQVAVIPDLPPGGVDTEEDVERVRRILAS
ncbi:MAG: 3-deoxy-manno-octulosonate cytidylyltransferase [Polyangiaceae bacterium]|jgi:3-deoxy-manno-octulosonate cytidylyltransferase (CMP-KDO synthetase)|nr:3-deoxy-manno-octulosonate cytidylyltransferase [Polyangiaceae bacterium]